MNKTLVINNQIITTIEELRSCFNRPEAAMPNTSLFIELIDRFVDGDIESFLRIVGEETLVEKVKRIPKGDSDTEMMNQLMPIISGIDSIVVFDPMQHIEVALTDMVNDKAVMKVKVVKQAIEKVELCIRQGFENSVTKTIQLNNCRLKEEVICEMSVDREGEEVSFLIGDKEIKKMLPFTDMTFIVKGVSFAMKLIEGGGFWMGAQSDDPEGMNYDRAANYDEKPVHYVKLDSYYIGETVVTQGLWQAVMGSNPSRFVHPDKPVDSVNWHDCQAFINNLNKMTEEQRGRRKFRLPTEAEWEYAAIGGQKKCDYLKYAGSNSMRSVGWYKEEKSHQVMKKIPNELGLFDMSGNVWEWCADWKGDYGFDTQTNPIGFSRGSERVLRGGSWYSREADQCRVSNRNSNNPNFRLDEYGFRLCLPQ